MGGEGCSGIMLTSDLAGSYTVPLSQSPRLSEPPFPRLLWAEGPGQWGTSVKCHLGEPQVFMRVEPGLRRSWVWCGVTAR